MGKINGFIGKLEKSKKEFSYLEEQTPYYISSESTDLETIINNMEITFGNIRDSLSISININTPENTIKIPEKFQYNYIENTYKKMIENNISINNINSESLFFKNYLTNTKETYENHTERIIIKNNLIRNIKGKLDREPDLNIYSGNYGKEIFNLTNGLTFEEEMKEVLELFKLFESKNNEYLINEEKKLYEKHLENLETEVNDISDLFGIDYLFARSQIRFILNKGSEKDKEKLKNYISDLKWEIQYYFKHIKKENQILIDIQLKEEINKNGLEDIISNKEMVENIFKKNPNSEIYIRIPKEGIQNNDLIGLNIKELPINNIYIIEREEINSIKLLKQMDIVFTKTSYLGFEGLLVGCEVICYGLPFYAGWGVTHDLYGAESYIFRRYRKNVSIMDLYTAVFLIHNKYFNPYKNKETPLGKDIYKKDSFMILKDDIEEMNNKNKKVNILLKNNKTIEVYKVDDENSLDNILNTIIKYKSYLSYKNRVFVINNSKERIKKVEFLKNVEGDIIYLKENEINMNDIYKNDYFIFIGSLNEYGSKILELKHLGCENIYYYKEVPNKIDKNIKTFFLDQKNHYQNYKFQSDLEDKINNKIVIGVLDKEEPNKYIDKYIENKITQFKKGKYSFEELKSKINRKIIVVIGQYEKSDSIKYAGLGLSNKDLIEKVKEDYPDYYLIFKPHPKSNEKLPKDIVNKIDLISLENVYGLISIADEVATISSFVGLEAMLINNNISTICYGLPFYAGWGVTIDKSSIEYQKSVCERREKGLFSMSFGLYDIEEESNIKTSKIIMEVFLFDYLCYMDINNEYYDLEYFLGDISE